MWHTARAVVVFGTLARVVRDVFCPRAAVVWTCLLLVRAALQNLCVSLHADGIGTKWTTGPVNFDPRFGEAAGLPADEYVIGTVWFGRAAAQPKAPRKRLSAEDLLSRHD